MIERISAAEAQRRMDEEGYVYVDVRSVPEFEEGHPRGAFNVPLLHQGPAGMTPNEGFLEAMSRRFPKDARLVLGCRSGNRSLRAATLLREAGYETVVDQRAGWIGLRDPFGQVTDPGWEASGLEAATVAEPGRSWAELEGK